MASLKTLAAKCSLILLSLVTREWGVHATKMFDGAYLRIYLFVKCFLFEWYLIFRMWV
jgi:hypothetical protein